ncbi:MAG TPA: hypothetical protein VFE24_02535 [Pirellulales bacterium]|jgi:hypothetical protein|nr:hypothetical protein [Pirellulales bacterium]
MRSRLNFRLGRGVGVAILLLLCIYFLTASAPAQRLRLRERIREANPQIEVFAGEPFGVGRITLPLAAGQTDFSPGTGDFQVTEKDGRVLYPAFDSAAPVRTLLRELLDRPPTVNFYFLFKGDQPLEITLNTPAAQRMTLQPVADKAGQQRLLAAWWKEFTQQKLIRSDRDSDMPPDVENYLSAMLARRLNLAYDREFGRVTGQADVDQTLGMLLGTESIRAAMQKNTILKTSKSPEPADQALPAAVVPPTLSLPTASDAVIEPIAQHVPHECFYVRFGSFQNFQWLRSTMDEWGGDLRNLLAVRGVDYGNSARLEHQLAMKEGPLSKLFGPQVVADVAIIGDDTFVREGACVGLLFQARNGQLLANDIVQQRRALLQLPGVKQEILDIAGNQVSFISTPDNSIRTFYAIDGDFHLVTNSRALVERFFDAGKGNDSLGDSKEFHYARSIMPVSSHHAAFVYLSDEFFRNLVGPKYRIEMTRRMQALTDLELLQLAKLAAKAEKKPAETLDDLVQGGFLPPGFDHQADGSHLVFQDGVYRDSLRGGRGTFLPIADVKVQGVTQAEVAAYQQFASAYRAQWERMDPVLVGIRREPGATDKRERIALDLHVTPFAKMHYNLLTNYLGPETKTTISPVAGDLISIRAVVGSLPFLNIAGGGTTHQLFFGLQDFNPPFDIRDGQVVPQGAAPPLGGNGPLAGLTSLFGNGLFDMMHGYLGAWPKAGVLDLLFGNRPLAADAEGYAQVPLLGLWSRRFNDFSVLSFHREVLQAITPQLSVVEAERPAQVRLHVADLTQAKLSDLVNAYAYQRARKTSVGNLQFLHYLALEFQLPREDCLAVAQNLLDAKLVCPLGGAYKLQEKAGLRMWTSTALESNSTKIDFHLPAGYQPPPMNWFRGLDLNFAMEQNAINANATIDVEHKTAVAPFTPVPVPAPGEKGLNPAPKPGLEEIPSPGSK